MTLPAAANNNAKSSSLQLPITVPDFQNYVSQSASYVPYTSAAAKARGEAQNAARKRQEVKAQTDRAVKSANAWYQGQYSSPAVATLPAAKVFESGFKKDNAVQYGTIKGSDVSINRSKTDANGPSWARQEVWSDGTQHMVLNGKDGKIFDVPMKDGVIASEWGRQKFQESAQFQSAKLDTPADRDKMWKQAGSLQAVGADSDIGKYINTQQQSSESQARFSAATSTVVGKAANALANPISTVQSMGAGVSAAFGAGSNTAIPQTNTPVGTGTVLAPSNQPVGTGTVLAP